MPDGWPRIPVNKLGPLLVNGSDVLLRVRAPTYAVLSLLTESLDWDRVWDFEHIPSVAREGLKRFYKDMVADDMGTDLLEVLEDQNTILQAIADVLALIEAAQDASGQLERVVDGCCHISPVVSDSFVEQGQGTPPAPVEDNYGPGWATYRDYLCQASQGVHDGVDDGLATLEDLLSLSAASIGSVGAALSAVGGLLGVAVAAPLAVGVALLAAISGVSVSALFLNLRERHDLMKQEIACAVKLSPNSTAATGAVDKIIDDDTVLTGVQKQLLKGFYHPGVWAVIFNGEDDEGNPVNVSQYPKTFCDSCQLPAGYVPLTVSLTWQTPPEWSITGETDRINDINERSDSTNMCGGGTSTQWCENQGAVTTGQAASPATIAQVFTEPNGGNLVLRWKIMRTSGTSGTDAKIRVLDDQNNPIFVYDKPISGQPVNQVDVWTDSVPVQTNGTYTVELTGSRWAFADNGTAVE